MQKAGLAIPSVIGIVQKQYFRKIFGRLAHCASVIPPDPRKRRPDKKAVRKYYNIPDTIQDQVTPATLKAIEKTVTGLGFKKTYEWVARVALDKDLTGVDPETALVVQTIHAECLERYRKPEYGKDPRYTCQIHLDYRVIR